MIKKAIIYSSIIFLVLNSFIYSQTKIISNTKVEKVIEPKLYTEKSIIKNVSKEELSDDFNAFVYFLKTSYIAYDEMIQKGFELEDFIADINFKIKNDVIKTSNDLIINMYEQLKCFISDTHFVLANNNYTWDFNLKYYEEKSNFPTEFLMQTNKNSVYLSMPGFLPDFLSKKTSINDYFQTVFTELKNIKKKKFLIIDLRNCPGGLADYPLLILYSLYENRDFVKPSDIYEARELLSEFIFRFSKSVKTPVTESLRYQRSIITCDSVNEDFCQTSWIMQKNNPKRIVFTDSNDSIKKLHKSNYNGRIIFITNHKTASAAEMIILLSKTLFPNGVEVVGQNTMGCLTYIDVFQFSMPNNSFVVSMAFKSIEDSLKEFDDWKGEGVGIEPDKICSDDEIISYLKKLTKDKKLRFENDK